MNGSGGGGGPTTIEGRLILSAQAQTQQAFQQVADEVKQLAGQARQVEQAFGQTAQGMRQLADQSRHLAQEQAGAVASLGQVSGAVRQLTADERALEVEGRRLLDEQRRMAEEWKRVKLPVFGGEDLEARAKETRDFYEQNFQGMRKLADETRHLAQENQGFVHTTAEQVRAAGGFKQWEQNLKSAGTGVRQLAENSKQLDQAAEGVHSMAGAMHQLTEEERALAQEGQRLLAEQRRLASEWERVKAPMIGGEDDWERVYAERDQATRDFYEQQRQYEEQYLAFEQRAMQYLATTAAETQERQHEEVRTGLVERMREQANMMREYYGVLGGISGRGMDFIADGIETVRNGAQGAIRAAESAATTAMTTVMSVASQVAANIGPIIAGIGATFGAVLAMNQEYRRDAVQTARLESVLFRNRSGVSAQFVKDFARQHQNMWGMAGDDIEEGMARILGSVELNKREVADYGNIIADFAARQGTSFEAAANRMVQASRRQGTAMQVVEDAGGKFDRAFENRINNLIKLNQFPRALALIAQRMQRTLDPLAAERRGEEEGPWPKLTRDLNELQKAMGGFYDPIVSKVSQGLSKFNEMMNFENATKQSKFLSASLMTLAGSIAGGGAIGGALGMIGGPAGALAGAGVGGLAGAIAGLTVIIGNMLADFGSWEDMLAALRRGVSVSSRDILEMGNQFSRWWEKNINLGRLAESAFKVARDSILLLKGAIIELASVGLQLFVEGIKRDFGSATAVLNTFQREWDLFVKTIVGIGGVFEASWVDLRELLGQDLPPIGESLGLWTTAFLMLGNAIQAALNPLANFSRHAREFYGWLNTPTPPEELERRRQELEKRSKAVEQFMAPPSFGPDGAEPVKPPQPLTPEVDAFAPKLNDALEDMRRFLEERGEPPVVPPINVQPPPIELPTGIQPSSGRRDAPIRIEQAVARTAAPEPRSGARAASEMIGYLSSIDATLTAMYGIMQGTGPGARRRAGGGGQMEGIQRASYPSAGALGIGEGIDFGGAAIGGGIGGGVGSGGADVALGLGRMPGGISRGAGISGDGTAPSDMGVGTTAPPAAPGTYRPVRELTEADLSDAVVNTIAGEARMSDPRGVDAVINTMFNRLGTKQWGRSATLQDVARAPGQFAGYRRATPQEAARIRERIAAIASGGEPDITGGAQEFRADWYRGPWMRKYGVGGVNIGGNVFAKTPYAVPGPYAPYEEPREAAGAPTGAPDRAALAAIEGGSHVVEQQAEVARTRKGALDASTRAYLEYAGRQTGLVAEVFSGGQPATGPHRTGSHRHDYGMSADVKLRDPQTGRILDMRNPADRARMADFIQHAVKAGATGVGAAPGYMGTSSIHIGGGKAAAWGAGGSSANVPDWVRDAWSAGMQAQMTPQQLADALKEKEQQQATLARQAQEMPAYEPRGDELFKAEEQKAQERDPLGVLSPEMQKPRDPLEALQLTEQQKMQLGRGRVDVQIALDKNLQIGRPSTYPAQGFDVGLAVDRTGTQFARPGDPSFLPSPLPKFGA